MIDEAMCYILGVTQSYHSKVLQFIDYSCKDGRFPVRTSCVTISNHNSLPSRSETGINPGIISWSMRLTDWDWCRKAVGAYDLYFTIKWKAEALQPGLEIDNLKSHYKSGTFKRMSWLNDSFSFESNDQRFLEEGVNTYNGTNVTCSYSLANFLMSSHL
jgi:hypothetical protein